MSKSDDSLTPHTSADKWVWKGDQPIYELVWDDREGKMYRRLRELKPLPKQKSE